MKPTTLALFMSVLTTVSAFAQASPATAASSGLSKEERDRAVTYLTETQKDFLATLEGLSEAQWKFKAAPDKWSIAETAEHIMSAEILIWDRMQKAMKEPPAPEKRAEVAGKDEMILKVIPDRSRKANAPEILQPTGKFPTKEELVKQFNETRGKEIAYVKETKEDLRSHFADHPFLKTMDGYQWLIFNGAHCKRHTAQIQEVKEDPNYPKS